MFLKPLVAICGLVISAASSASIINLVENGGFETGDLTAWSSSNLGPSGDCGSGLNRTDWNVSTSPTATDCSTPGSPLSGVYAAYMMNDSGVPDTLFTLSQDIFVPTTTTSGNLSWSSSNVSNYIGSPRHFSVDLFSSSGTLLGNVYSLDIPFNDPLAEWDNFSFDISSILTGNVGETITLTFSTYIPETWTGPAGFGLDNVSLNAQTSAVSLPGTLGLIGLGLLVTGLRRKH